MTIMPCSPFPPLPLLLLLLLLVSLPCVSPNNGHTNRPLLMTLSEQETLFTVMESISSDHPWRISFPNPCKPGSSWPGIECKPGLDSYLHVIRLDFGTPPNPSCKSTATFPPQIFHLPHLQSVFFFHCFTHSKTTISVSKVETFGSSLQQLSLRSNPALIGPIPPQISSLKSLQILTLSQNQLGGTIPLEIFSLSALVHLDLSYNSLHGSLPIQLGSLKNLVGLDLSYNDLTGIIPPSVGQLGMLQKLDLSSNSLTGSIPESIEKLSNLAFVALSNNRLNGKFPKGLSKLQSLQYFLMDDNPLFIPLPEVFGQLQKLQELRLASSGFSGKIPESFSQLKNLTTLSLQNNRLVGEIPLGFGSFLRLYHLNLSRNFLGGVVPFNSSFLRRLGANLDLSGNPGLCLPPSEAYAVKMGGVGVCGNNKSLSVAQPLKESGASPCAFFFPWPLLILGASAFMAALQHR